MFWKPNKFQAEDNGSTITKNSNNSKNKSQPNKNNKRAKNNNGNSNQRSYANVTKSTTTNKHKHNHKQHEQQHHQHTSNAIKSMSTTTTSAKISAKVEVNDPIISQMQTQIDSLREDQKNMAAQLTVIDLATTSVQDELANTQSSVTKVEKSVNIIENNMTTFATKSDMTKGFENLKSGTDDLKYMMQEMMKGIKIAEQAKLQPPMPPPSSRVPGAYPASAAPGSAYYAASLAKNTVVPPLPTIPKVSTYIPSVPAGKFVDMTNELDEPEVDSSFEQLLVDMLDEDNPKHQGKQVPLVKIKIEPGLENVNPRQEKLAQQIEELKKVKKETEYDTRRGTRLTVADRLFDIKEDAILARGALLAGMSDQNNSSITRGRSLSRSPLRDRSSLGSEKC